MSFPGQKPQGRIPSRYIASRNKPWWGPNAGETAKTQVSQLFTFPAPTGGLNAVDSISAMPPTDALVLDNIFPQPTYATVRNGYINWVTGFAGWVETLMDYTNSSGENLFAISGGSVYNVTSSGTLGSAVVTGLSNSRWEHTNVGTPAGQFLYAANAVNKPLYYDGTTWVSVDGASSPAITGVTTTTLRNPVVWKNRLWFVQDKTFTAWYLPTASIGGAASSIDFSMYFRKGGYLQAIIPANLSDGSTFDQYLCFLSSEGELLLYAGTDPATAGLFNLQGIYDVGQPVGRRCWGRIGDDVVIITSEGIVSLSKAIASGQMNQQETVSYKILNLINNAVQNYNANFGWQAITYPLGNKLIINVPVTTNSQQIQYVMNTINGSWCSFSNWNAACFATLGNKLYFGTSTKVVQADGMSVLSDAATNITTTWKSAFSYMTGPGQKFFKMIRPLIGSDGTINLAMNVNVDFQDMKPTTTPTFSKPTGATWDVSLWDVSFWAGGVTTQHTWQTVTGVGFCAALYAVGVTNGAQLQFLGSDIVYTPGGVL